MTLVRRFSLRDATAVIGLLALVAALSRVPHIGRLGWDRASTPAHSTQDRELAALILAQDPNLFLRAAKIIPLDATYSVVVGNSPPTNVDLTQGIPLLYQYWLLPRHFTNDVHDADWVITYDHSSETLGVRYSEEIGIGPTSNIVKVIR